MVEGASELCLVRKAIAQVDAVAPSLRVVNEGATELRRDDDFLQVLFVGKISAPHGRTPPFVVQTQAQVQNMVGIAAHLAVIRLSEAEGGRQRGHGLVLHGVEPRAANETGIGTA